MRSDLLDDGYEVTLEDYGSLTVGEHLLTSRGSVNLDAMPARAQGRWDMETG